MLGYTGEISPDELKRLRRSYRAGDSIGKAGIEAAYDSYLRGRPGLGQIRVDSLGRQVSPYVPRQESTPGYALRLTLDMKLQRAAEQALQYGIDLAHQNDQWAANGGAIVALDPRDGAVLALASAPTFKPSVFVGRTDPKKLEALYSDTNNPLFDRATAGLYPPGSIWKPVTALAGMQEHVFSAYDSLQCTPSATYGLDNQRFRNWNPYVNRPMTLPEALAESCDTYFYEIGNRFYEGGTESRVRMQQWARKFGFGQPTGLDIGGEADGLVPTPEWRKRTFESDWDRAWNPGDSIQLAIGQKDLLVTPLQMTAFYAMLANGGNLVKPYLVSDVEQAGGKGSPRVVLRRFAAAPPSSAGVDPEALRAVQDGLYRGNTFGERHVVWRLRQLRGADLGQDGYGGEGRPASRLPGGPPRGPVVVVRVGAVGVGAARRVRPHRERRPRFERRRAGRIEGVRALLQRRGAAGDVGGHGLVVPR